MILEAPDFHRTLTLSTENFPLEILIVDHIPFTKYLGSKWPVSETFYKFCYENAIRNEIEYL